MVSRKGKTVPRPVNAHNHISGFLLITLVLLAGNQSVKLYGESMSLEELLQRTGVAMKWDSLRSAGQLSRDGNTVVFRPGDPWMVLNGRRLLLSGPVIERNGQLIFSEEAVSALLKIYRVEKEPSGHKLITILIDPGHGGRDTGALRHWKVDGVQIPLAEKDVVLDISLQLAEKLRSSYPDKNIILTRDKDVYPTLEERVHMANNVSLEAREGMLYLSIHANASLNSRAEGYEIWYLPRNYRRNIVNASLFGHKADSIAPIINALWEEEYTHESIHLADLILESLQSLLGPDIPNRGRREESWFVVRNVKMASVLIEVGFISNQYEASRLAHPDYLRLITEGIYNGIRDFVDYFENRE